MPKPSLEDSNGTIYLTHTGGRGEDKQVHTFPKSISPKVSMTKIQIHYVMFNMLATMSFYWLILKACQPIWSYFRPRLRNCIHFTFIFTFLYNCLRFFLFVFFFKLKYLFLTMSKTFEIFFFKLLCMVLIKFISIIIFLSRKTMLCQHFQIGPSYCLY